MAYGVIDIENLRKSDVAYDAETDTFSTMKYHMTFSRTEQIPLNDVKRRHDYFTNPDYHAIRSGYGSEPSSPALSKKAEPPRPKNGCKTLEELMMMSQAEFDKLEYIPI